MLNENKKVDINKHEIDIGTLKKQNVNDLLSIKELYSKLKETENKISRFKYINNTLVNKLKKDYENLKKTILDESVHVKLINDIESINLQLDKIENNDIETINSKLDTIANKGTTVEVIERVTKEEIDRQLADGTIANLTMKDNSITNEKYKEKSISINKVDFINYTETITGNLIDETIFKGKKVSELQRFECPITNGDLIYYWKLTDTAGTLGNTHVVFFLADVTLPSASVLIV